MLVNLKVRAKNKAFWVSLVPMLVILVQFIAGMFGWQFIDLEQLQGRLIALVDAVFAVLGAIGIVSDFTTKGFSDSERALGYEEPAPNAKEAE